ncbi:AEC family transporter [Natronincola ferrireducens]|uniref:Predicted permease n=1 Tax=Natronincola ferrireducens TaxID=393762 RepID=A0A1G8YRE8_9FIRM|nr:AEC family transporter [Natronincola ferrireducens]SDK05371.1 Predicted permease [Natronincola ferrireducens]
MHEALSNLISMVMLITLGYIIRIKKTSLDDLSNIVVDICLPALILYSTITTFSKEVFQQAVYTFVLGIVAALIGLVLGICVLRFLKIQQEDRGAFLITSSFGNTGFIGLPLIMLLFGQEGLLLAVCFDFGMNIILWSIGINILQNTNKLFTIKTIKNLGNPFILAIIAGILINILEIEVPNAFLTFIESLGNIASPIAMIFIGLMLKQMNFKDTKHSKSVIALIVIKLILVPFCIFVISKTMFIDEIVVVVSLLQSAMPCMASAPIIVKRFQGDSTYPAIGVLLSTIISIATIPLLIGLVQMIFNVF